MEGSPVLEVVESPLDVEEAIRANEPLPDALPVLPLRETVTFPETLTPLAVGQARSIKLVDDVLGANRMLAMVASRDPEKEEPGPGDLYEVGVVGVVARMLKVPDGTLRILVQGAQRIRLGPYVAEEPYLVARIEEMPDVLEPSAELEALTRNVQRTFSEIIEQIPYLPEELQMAVANIEDPAALGHLIAGALRISTEEKQKLLEEVDVAKRLRHLSRILARELEVVQLGTQIQSQVQSEIDKGQREFFLRQQLKAIQDELGEGDEQQAEVNELRERIEQANLPEHARKAAERELSRLEKLPPAAAEHGVIRTYLEWLVELPWSVETEDNLDIAHAREVLDADHYDLEKVKDRILEYLAVRKLNPDSPGPILCFVGPPGVGKTSLGRSIAQGAGPRVRADLGRRRPRRGGDPRPPPHLHRRPAGDDRPRPARRRLPQPRLHDRRDRQDGLRLPRRPRLGDAGGARPGAERHLPRPLPRPRVRPLRRDVHRHGEHPRHDPRPAARPDGDDRAGRLHARGEEAHRPPLPGAAPDRGQRAEALPDRVLRRGPGGDHRGVHPRGRRPQPGAPDRRDLPQNRPRSRRGQGGRQGEGLRQAGPRAARPPPRSSPSSAAAPRTPASPPAWPGLRPAATCSSSRRPRCPAPAS